MAAQLNDTQPTHLTKQYFTIGEAANVLNVSIDTLRRWQSNGKISAIRSAGGIRLFPLSEIERLQPEADKISQYLSVSQAATFLGVSPATLRRWDRHGLLKPVRTMGNERAYDQADLTAFVKHPVTPQDATQSPVQFLKNKAAEISDTIVITLLDKSIFQRYQPKIIGASAFVALFVFSVAVITSTAVDKKEATDSTEVLQTNFGDDLANVSSKQHIDTQEATIISRDGNAYTIYTSPPNGQSQISLSNPKALIRLANSNFELPQPEPSIDTTFPNAQEVNVTLSSTEADKTVLLTSQSLAYSNTGTAILPENTTTLFVDNTSVTATSKVFITPSDPEILIAVTQKTAGSGFWIKTKSISKQPVSFDYMIVN